MLQQVEEQIAIKNAQMEQAFDEDQLPRKDKVKQKKSDGDYDAVKFDYEVNEKEEGASDSDEDEGEEEDEEFYKAEPEAKELSEQERELLANGPDSCCPMTRAPLYSVL